MAGMGYRQKFASVLFSFLTVLGGGLPRRLGFNESGALVIFGEILAVEPTSAWVKRVLLLGIQLVEIVKLTVILACVSTGSAPM
jgi:hypothetical protein